MIELKNIYKKYKIKNGYHTVLNDINYIFEKNKNVGILGKNGAGKSTLMRIIGGAEYPDKGSVIRKAKVSWPIGFTGGFCNSLSGRKNLKFTCRLYNADIDSVTHFVEEFSELGKFLDEPIKKYSSGMRAKLAFGLSMAIGFDYLLIDELTAVGDASFRKKSEEIFLKRKSESSLIIVSHNLGTISKYCDKVAVLHEGELIDCVSMSHAARVYKRCCFKK